MSKLTTYCCDVANTSRTSKGLDSGWKTQRLSSTGEGELAHSESAAAESNDWKLLYQELKKRTCDPLNDFTFFVYLLLAIFVFGGLGIWVELFKPLISSKAIELSSLTIALITYFPAQIGSTGLQLVLSSHDKRDKLMMSFGIFVFVVFMLASIALSLLSAQHPTMVLTLSSLCAILAVWLWWVTNSVDSTYRKGPTPDAPTGGEPNRSLPGTLDNFTV